MYIDEYIVQHPEKLPEGQDLMEFSGKCEEYLEWYKDLVPYDSKTYVEDVFDMCIGLVKDDMFGNLELEQLCKDHDEKL